MSGARSQKSGVDNDLHGGFESCVGEDFRGMCRKQHRAVRDERPCHCNRGDWIRTSDPLTPSQVRYRTAPRPD